MWYTFLTYLLSMSLSAGIVILVVLLARFLLRRTPKVFSYVLWSVVLFRLLCPITLSSNISILRIVQLPIVGSGIVDKQEELSNHNYDEQKNQSSLKQEIPEGLSYHSSDTREVLSSYNNDIQGEISDRNKGIQSNLPVSMQAEQSVETSVRLLEAIGYLWLFGVVVFLLYSAVSLLKLRRSLAAAIPLRDNIYLTDYIATPFVIGLLHPKIYLPSSLSEGEQDFILLHEQYHLRRFDHIVKLLAYTALCIHWFNPLVWVAFLLSGRDMEMSCDEAVLKKMGEGIRTDYTSSLLSLATGRRMIAGAPLAFGEGNTKARIKNALRWKKPPIWVTVIAASLCMLVITACAANPKKEPLNTADPFDRSYQVDAVIPSTTPETRIEASDSDPSPDKPTPATTLDAALTTAILDYYKSQREGKNNEFACESHIILSTEENQAKNVDQADSITVYAMVLYQIFSTSDVGLKEVGGSHIPTALTFEVNSSGEYTLIDYWQPSDGSYYVKDIQGKFPLSIQKNAIDTQKYILQQIQSCYAQAIEYYKLDTSRVVEQLFEKILSSPSEASIPGLYIDAHPIEYRELTYYNDYTLQYIFTEFLKGNQTDLKGHLMRIVMDTLIGNEAIRTDAANGQEYFDAWAEAAEQLDVKYGLDYMKSNAPKAYLFLQVKKYYKQ